MSAYKYNVGEPVYIVGFNGKPTRLAHVTEIKEYKWGPRVITNDGQEWDVVGHCYWGQRQIAYYTGSQIAPVTPELDAAYTNIQAKHHAEWLVRHWDQLTAEQTEEVRTFVRAIRKKIWLRGG